MVAKKILTTILVVVLLLSMVGLAGCAKTFNQDEVDKQIAAAKNTAVSETKGPLENQISELKSQISEKNDKIDSLEDKISTSGASNVSSELESLKADKATLESKVADLQKQLDAKNSLNGKVVIELSNADLENGALIKSNGNDLNLNDNVSDVLNNGELTRKELPSILSDGVIVNEDYPNDEMNYEQYIKFYGTDVVKFGRGTDIGDEQVPVVYLDMSSSSNYYDYVVNLKDRVDFTALKNSETVTIAGKEYTVKPGLTSTGNLVLLGNENTVLLSLGQEKTVDGITYTLLGANTKGEGATAILKVGSSQKTVTEGQSYYIGGHEVYVKSLYVTDIPTTDASIEIFVGSQEMEIAQSDAPQNLQINGESVDGVEAYVDNMTGAREILFRITPSQTTNNDANKYVELGSKFVDPVFGLSINFQEASEDLKATSKSDINLEKSGDTISLSFTNDNGDKYNIDVYEYTNSAYGFAEDFVGQTTQVARDQYFITSDVSGKTTYVYKVENFNKDSDGVLSVEFKDLSTGKLTSKTREGEYIGDSNLKINSINYSAKTLMLDDDTLLEFNTENEGRISLSQFNVLNDATVTFTEGQKADESGIIDNAVITAHIFDTDGTGSDHIGIGNVIAPLSPAYSSSNKDGKVGYILTQFGTYVEYDKDNGNYLDLYYPKNAETKYYVSVSQDNANVVKETKEFAVGDVLSGFGTIKSIN